MESRIYAIDPIDFENYAKQHKDELFQTLTNDLNMIRGGKMMDTCGSARKVVFDQPSIKAEIKAVDFWIRFKSEFDAWEKERNAKKDRKIADLQRRVMDLESQNVELAKELVEYRQQLEPIAARMGFERRERK